MKNTSLLIIIQRGSIALSRNKIFSIDKKEQEHDLLVMTAWIFVLLLSLGATNNNCLIRINYSLIIDEKLLIFLINT